MLAPIVLFVYNRPEHTRKTLESLEKNDLAKESELFIFADGPKENTTEKQLEKITKTRKIIREKNWCGKISIIEREINLGLDSSVTKGITSVIEKFGKVIVLEDDFILSKNFLKYMNSALDKFENNNSVMQISGYMFPVEIPEKFDTFFLPFTNSWGWATWKRAWDFFDESANGLKILEKDKELRKKFNLNNSCNYYRMALKQKEKGNYTWDILFYLSVFMKKGIVLYPRKTMVINGGLDWSGTHCKLEIKQGNIDNNFIVNKFDNLFLDTQSQDKIYRFLNKQNNLAVRIFNTFISKIKNQIKNI